MHCYAKCTRYVMLSASCRRPSVASISPQYFGDDSEAPALLQSHIGTLLRLWRSGFEVLRSALLASQVREIQSVETLGVLSVVLWSSHRFEGGVHISLEPSQSTK